MNYNNNNYPNYNPQLLPQTPPIVPEPEYFQEIDMQAPNTAPHYNQAAGAPLFYQNPPVYAPQPGNQPYNYSQPYNYQQANIYPKKNNAALVIVLVIIAAVVLVVTGMISFISSVSETSYYYEEPYNIYENYGVNEYDNIEQILPGEVFEYDGFEVTIHDEYSFTYVDNEYSEFYMQDLVRVPVTIKNISGSTTEFTSYNIKVFLTSGIESDDYAGFFFDDSIDMSKEMRNGASQELAIYFLYDGDGDYYIIFDNYSGDAYELNLFLTK